jgi:SOS-response transcriptional repressor LexA
MTPRQQDTLAFIARSLVEAGRSPTLDAIAAEVGLGSRSNAHAMVSKLIAQGYLRREPSGSGKTSNYTVLRAIDRADAPVFGDVLAGIPTDAIRAELTRREEPSHG